MPLSTGVSVVSNLLWFTQRLQFGLLGCLIHRFRLAFLDWCWTVCGWLRWLIDLFLGEKVFSEEPLKLEYFLLYLLSSHWSRWAFLDLQSRLFPPTFLLFPLSFRCQTALWSEGFSYLPRSLLMLPWDVSLNELPWCLLLGESTAAHCLM